MSKPFVHLHTHSHYSFLDGLAKVDQIVDRAKILGMPALALTEHGNVYGAIEFYQLARKAGIKPILGMEAYVAPRGRTQKEHGVDNKYFHLTLLCETMTGWLNLIQLVTHSHLEGFYYKPRIDRDLITRYHEGLICLSGCYSGEVIRKLVEGKSDEAEEVARWYQQIFGVNNYFIEIGHHPGVDPLHHETIQHELVRISKKIGAPLVATQDVHYLDSEDAPYHSILLSVQNSGGTLRKLDDDFSMRSSDLMNELFKDYPEAIDNTIRVADRCSVTLELDKTILPSFPLPSGETEASYMRTLVEKNIHTRYDPVTDDVRARVNFELDVIINMGYPGYFLIVHDFIQWARDRGIVVGPGRGSAAGSIVSYILHITNVDPLKYGLLFERFLNPDRIQMPDIDVDIADVRRDEVIGYLREKYGADHVANIITFGTMAARAAIRDTGRALGLEYSFCDRIAKLIPFNAKLDEAINEVSELKEMYASNTDAKKLLDAAKKLEGCARHASVHACGVVIGDKALTHYLPLQHAPQDETSIITQFEMHTCEKLGLLKMDLLGLKNLTIIENTRQLIKERGKGNVDIDTVPTNDSATYEMLQRGDTTGVFQFESAGMRRFMKELEPTELEDLVALVALYRPGPIDLIPSYIARKHGREEVSYLHPLLEPIMKTTYGIGVYQEQMMRIARDLAGFTLAEADGLRKAIGKKIKELLDEMEVRIVEGMMSNGINEKTARAIWDLFPPFARYGFNKSHAVCYALIGYQTAYLRANYPVEFMTSLMNADSGDVERMAFLVNECTKMNIKVLPPDINASQLLFFPDGDHIRFGLQAIKNVGDTIIDAIVQERVQHGPFTKLSDLLMRVKHKDLNKKSIESLVKCGAFDGLSIDRNLVVENIDEILKFISALRKQQNSNQVGLFGNEVSIQLHLKPVAPASVETKLAWEKELLGLYVSDHPLNALRATLEKYTQPIAKALIIKDEKARFAIGGIIASIKNITTKKGDPMLFAVIEDFTDSIEIVVFPRVLEEYGFHWVEGATVFVRGSMSWRDNTPKFIADKAIDLKDVKIENKK